MSKDFELNLDGLRELMKSDEMKSILNEAGAKVQEDAERMSGGLEWAHTVRDASYVSICNIYPNSKEAAQENMAKNTALKALQVSGLPTSKG